jgi:hypothetical protein
MNRRAFIAGLGSRVISMHPFGPPMTLGNTHLGEQGLNQRR